MGKPLLSHAGRPATVEIVAINQDGESVPTSIAGESPLTIYVDRRELVTLMTLGQAPEALVIGYLRNQRLVPRIEDIEAVQVDWDTDSCAVTMRRPLQDIEARTSKRTVTSGCGQGTVFGGLMDDIDAISLPTDGQLDEATLHGLLDVVRRHETIYKAAGAVHGCALFRGTELMYFVEDVGRHNAVDAIAGLMWLDEIGGADKIFYTTGRLTSEMVIKAAQMGIPFLVSRSGLTQMGYDIARRVGITMIGRSQGKHYLLFTGADRFRRAAAPPA
ncbi:MAG: formate dehydrogenase accessory sulfurtransferase FdhD [Sterolibacteriaceae bacterium]|nr:formate dehydrogenase accessory sulfurtransferase FdhD [Sterolibacteriaceae bacterium]